MSTVETNIMIIKTEFHIFIKVDFGFSIQGKC